MSHLSLCCVFNGLAGGRAGGCNQPPCPPDLPARPHQGFVFRVVMWSALCIQEIIGCCGWQNSYAFLCRAMANSPENVVTKQIYVVGHPFLQNSSPLQCKPKRGQGHATPVAGIAGGDKMDGFALCSVARTLTLTLLLLSLMKLALSGCGGGSGATSVTYMLAKTLEGRGHSTFMVDCCPQKDLTRMLRRKKPSRAEPAHATTDGRAITFLDLPLQNITVTNRRRLKGCDFLLFIVAADYRGPSVLDQYITYLLNHQLRVPYGTICTTTEDENGAVSKYADECIKEVAKTLTESAFTFTITWKVEEEDPLSGRLDDELMESVLRVIR